MKKFFVCPYLVRFLAILVMIILTSPLCAKILGEDDFLVCVIAIFASIVGAFLVAFFVILFPQRFAYVVVENDSLKCFFMGKEKNCVRLNEDVYYIISDAMITQTVYRRYIIFSNRPIGPHHFGNNKEFQNLAKVCLNYNWNEVIAVPYNSKIIELLDIDNRKMQVVNKPFGSMFYPMA